MRNSSLNCLNWGSLDLKSSQLPNTVKRYPTWVVLTSTCSNVSKPQRPNPLYTDNIYFEIKFASFKVFRFIEEKKNQKM